MNTEKYDRLSAVITSVKGKVNHVGRRILENSNIQTNQTQNQSKQSNDNLKKTVTTQTDFSTPSPVKSSDSSSVHLDPVKVHKTPFMMQPKVLYVSDSVGSSANMRLVEKFSKTRVRSLKVSGSEEELQQTVESNLEFPGREAYDILAISAPTDDITKLNLHQSSRTDIKQQVHNSCLKVFNVAKYALSNHNDLKKVILLNHPPRFDNKVKSEMALYANETMNKLVEESQLKNLVIGSHNLACIGIGKTFDARYKDSLSKRVDGIHFFGPLGTKHYSESLTNILADAAKYVNTNVYSTDTKIDSNIPVENRYEILDSGNFLLGA